MLGEYQGECKALSDAKRKRKTPAKPQQKLEISFPKPSTVAETQIQPQVAVFQATIQLVTEIVQEQIGDQTNTDQIPDDQLNLNAPDDV